MDGSLTRALDTAHQVTLRALNTSQGNRGPKPDKPTKNTTVNDNGATTGDGTIFSRLGDTLLANPIVIPILIVAALIGIAVGWRRLTAIQNERGRPLRPLGAILKDTLRFAFREDTRRLHPKIPLLTGRRTYLLLTAAGIAGFIYPGHNLALAWPALAVLLYARAAKIFKTRQQIIRQMFEVAHGECRYPKGAELAPWSRIHIQRWINLVSPGTTVVTIPPAYQSEDLKTREKFERQFNGTISEDNSWTYTWESAKNRIVCTPASFLPTMAPYPGPNPEWDKIDIGIKTDGTKASVDLSTMPHTLICGPTGSGKSVLQRMILFHCLSHPETWKIVGVDPKMVEMSWLRKYPNVLKIALSLEESVEVITQVRDEMRRRYEEMSEMGVVHFQKLGNPPPALMLMVDETFNLLAPEGIKSDEGKERDAMHAQASALLGEIARLGRAAGVHLVLATQRPDATVIKGEMKNNLDCRIAAGRLDTTPSLMVLDSEAATRLPKIRGRGMVRLGGDMDTFQGFFAEQSWFDEQLEAARAHAAGEAVAGDETPSRRGRGRPKGEGRLARMAARAAARAAALDVADVSGGGAEPSVDLASADVQGPEVTGALEGTGGVAAPSGERALDRPEGSDLASGPMSAASQDVAEEDLEGWDGPGEWAEDGWFDDDPALAASMQAMAEEARMVSEDEGPAPMVAVPDTGAAMGSQVEQVPTALPGVLGGAVGQHAADAAVVPVTGSPGRFPTYFARGPVDGPVGLPVPAGPVADLVRPQDQAQGQGGSGDAPGALFSVSGGGGSQPGEVADPGLASSADGSAVAAGGSAGPAGTSVSLPVPPTAAPVAFGADAAAGPVGHVPLVPVPVVPVPAVPVPVVPAVAVPQPPGATSPATAPVLPAPVLPGLRGAGPSVAASTVSVPVVPVVAAPVPAIEGAGTGDVAHAGDAASPSDADAAVGGSGVPARRLPTRPL